MNLSGESWVEKLPYQKYNDSPTIKLYTSWRLYEESISPPTGRAEPLIKGSVLPGAETLELLPDGSFRGSGEAAEEKPFLFSMQEGRVLAKHFLRVRNAVVLRIPRGKEKKLEAFAAPPISGSSHHHLRVELEEGASASLALISTGKGSSGASMVTAEIIAEKGSSLRLWVVSAFAGGGLPLSWIRVLSDGGKVEIGNVAVGGLSNAVYEDVFMRGERGKANIRSFLLASRGEKVDHVTNISSESSFGSSKIVSRGFNFGGTVVHRGKLKASQSAVESENELSSIIYRAGNGAKSYSVPSLEVESSSVLKASHETSVSPIPEDAIFYMRSRGLKREEAVELLVRSSLLWSIEGISAEAVEKAVSGLLRGAL